MRFVARRSQVNGKLLILDNDGNRREPEQAAPGAKAALGRQSVAGVTGRESPAALLESSPTPQTDIRPMPARQSQRSKPESHSPIGIDESELWSMADALRGSMDAAIAANLKSLGFAKELP